MNVDKTSSHTSYDYNNKEEKKSITTIQTGQGTIQTENNKFTNTGLNCTALLHANVFVLSIHNIYIYI